MALFLLFRTRPRAALLLFLLAAASMAPSARALSFHHRRRPIVVGYFTNDGLRKRVPFNVKSLVTNGSAALLDQINYSAASVSGGHCSLSDATADLRYVYPADESVSGRGDDPNSGFSGYLHQLQELKQRYPRLKIFISLEGRASDFAYDAQPENRLAFVRSCVDMYLRGHFARGITVPGLFDGVDIDWESPHRDDAANFKALLEEFHRQMRGVRPGLLLSVAVGQSPHMMPDTDFAALNPLVDEFGVMSYDYHGPWDRRTGFVAPLFAGEPGSRRPPSIRKTIDAFQASGIPLRKMLMGVPFYGYGWTDVDETENGLHQMGHGVRGDRPYKLIRTLGEPDQIFRDPRSQAPWIYDGEDFWTFEDPVSLRYKTSYAVLRGMAGIMIWELSGDTSDAELLNSVWRSLRHPLPNRVFAQALAAPTRSATALAER